jgi:fused signal recognition particle receptor
MFGILKKKLAKVAESISKKFERKEEVAKDIEKKIEQLPEEKIVEEIKPIIEEKIPEVKEEIKEELEKIEEAEPKEKKSLFKKIKEKIVKKITEKKLSEEEISPILNELATDLIEADVAFEVAEKIKNDLKESLVGKEIKRGKEKEIVIESLKKSLLDILSVQEIDFDALAKKKPAVLLFLGFNGSGKTTSLAKLANWLMKKEYSCIFAAADTFRAAAEEQLEEHAKNLGVKVIKHKYGADPAAVVFDAIKYGSSKGINFVMADTAGRTHVDANLMNEMKKIIRVNKPDLKILVIDSLTGNDAVLQARMFGELGIDAVIFTKVDVNEKGGAILSVTHELKKPILFLGIGQEYNNLEKFEAEKFVNQILS